MAANTSVSSASQVGLHVSENCTRVYNVPLLIHKLKAIRTFQFLNFIYCFIEIARTEKFRLRSSTNNMLAEKYNNNNTNSLLVLPPVTIFPTEGKVRSRSRTKSCKASLYRMFCIPKMSAKMPLSSPTG